MLSKANRPIRYRGTMAAAWLVIWLAIADIGVNLAFGLDTASGQPSALQRYFDYGRSVEGKLARLVAADPATAGQIISAGWGDAALLKSLTATKQPQHDLLLAAYGQSFTMQAAHGVAEHDGRITVRSVGGPAAPPSHSYARYKDDQTYRRADVVLFGVLSSSVASMGSLSGLIWAFENPAPFTFPRYRVRDGVLTEETPLITTEAEFRKAFTERSPQWERFKSQLQHSDRGYDRLSFNASMADASAIARLLRRGWVAHRHSYDSGVYEPGIGFNPQSEEVQALKAIFVDMALRSRHADERLIVLLLHARGQGDHLNAAFGETLRSAGIETISTHTLFSANDPANFLPDGHYTEEANGKLIAALHRLIRSAPPRSHDLPSPATPQNAAAGTAGSAS